MVVYTVKRWGTGIPSICAPAWLKVWGVVAYVTLSLRFYHSAKYQESQSVTFSEWVWSAQDDEEEVFWGTCSPSPCDSLSSPTLPLHICSLKTL